MNLGEIINEVKQFEHFKSFKCSDCSIEIQYYVLQIYADCPNCKKQFKVRAFGSTGTEIEDLIDAVLLWLGTGKTFDEALKRREEMLKDSE